MTPKFELGRDFCTIHLATKFHHSTFNGLEVIELTNKNTYAAESIHLAMLRRWVNIFREMSCA